MMGMIKAEFMTLWDGLRSASERILVLGATNRPGDIDSAILRRMPKRFAVSLPSKEQRGKILALVRIYAASLGVGLMVLGLDVERYCPLAELVSLDFGGSDGRHVWF